MRKLSLLFAIVFISISSSCLAEQTWDLVYPKYPIVEYHTVFFLDDNIGWVGGERGVIIHTENAGESWEEIENNVNEVLHEYANINYNYHRELYNINIIDIAFLDKKNGFIVVLFSDKYNPKYSNLLRTKDGGITFEVVDKFI
jgi:photosystem II stability/assembly factor-like uncharacterized protein